jgi:hypothetical protein
MRKSLAPAIAFVILAAPAVANDPPAIDHQPALCTVPEKALSLCAAVSDDGNVAVARIYFRPAGEDYYAFVVMSFTGVSYCGTLPAVRAKAKAVEYYVQATDDSYQTQRTSTFRLPIQPDGVCEFPPEEKDAARKAAIKVFATNRKQGRKLDDAFAAAGVTFVPIS